MPSLTRACESRLVYNLYPISHVSYPWSITPTNRVVFPLALLRALPSTATAKSRMA